ncbi:MAG: acetyltransferase [Candidatus Omnitrophota bacterium]
MKKLVIIGAGDGARVVSQLVKGQKGLKLEGFIDDNKSLQGKKINGYRVLGRTSDLNKFSGYGFVVAIGLNIKARRSLFEKAKKAGLKPVNIIHKSAVIDKTAEISKGAIILPNCVVGAFARLSDNVFLFSGVIIEHDAKIGNNVYLSPGVSLAGHTKAGNNTFFGINSCTVENISVGSDVIVGAGAVILKDVPDKMVVAGVPARIIRKNNG